MRRTTLATASLLAGAFLATSPARAGDAQCLWEHFPEAKRIEVLSHDMGALSATMQATFTDDEYVASLRACGVAGNAAPAANAALNAYGLRLKAEKVLLASADLPPDRLDAAWNALGEDLRQGLIRHALDSAQPDPTYEAVQQFADRAGLRGAVGKDIGVTLAAYLIGRAALAAYDPQF